MIFTLKYNTVSVIQSYDLQLNSSQHYIHASLMRNAVRIIW